MQICPRCGKEMDDNAPACPSCHAPNAFQNPEQFNKYIYNRRQRNGQGSQKQQRRQQQFQKQKERETFQKEQERLRILYERQQAERQQQIVDYYKEQTRREELAKRKKKRGMKLAVSIACCFIVLIGSIVIGLAVGSAPDDEETIAESGQTATPSAVQITEPTETTLAETPSAETPVPVPQTEEPTGAESAAPASGNSIYKQTVMIYIIGSDLESQSGAAAMDMEEIEEGVADSTNVNCLMYTGGCTSWTNDVSSTKNSIYLVENGKKELKEAEEQKNMAQASTLTHFINYCYKKYKADKYTLILWDHGGGAIHGYGRDEIAQSDMMSLSKLKKALGDSDLCQSEKMETIVFDACLMGSAEVAAGLKEYARFFVASEESIAGPGLDYSFLKDLNEPQMDGRKVGSSIVDSFYKFYNEVPISRETTLSCIDLGQMPDVESSLGQLASKADKGLKKNFNKLKKSRRTLKEYGKEATFCYDLVDASGMAEGMKTLYPSEAEALQNAVQNAVVSCRTTGENAKGLTLYYPYSQNDYGPASLMIYSDFNFVPQYRKYIDDFLNKNLQNSRAVHKEIKAARQQDVTKAGTDREQEGVASVVLPTELVDSYEKARYYILKKMPGQEDSYLIAGAGEDVLLNQDVLTARGESTIVKILDKTEQKEYDASVYLREETDTSKIYSANAILQRESIALGGHRETQTLYATVNVMQDKKSGEYKPLDAVVNERHIAGITGIAPRLQTDLSQFTSICYGVAAYIPTYDEDGAMKPVDQWKMEAEPTYNEYIPSNEYAVEQKTMPKDGTYGIVFEITDEEGQIHMSEIQMVGE